MKLEADERNKKLTTDEKNRNEKWMVVGRRGEKRLIKGVERDIQFMGRQDTRENTFRGPVLLPSEGPRGQFVPRQGGKDKPAERQQEENGRWYRKDKEAETGARKKDNYGQGNKNGGEKDKQDQSRNNRWETNTDRWAQPTRDRLNSKRGRGTDSSEEDSPDRRRSKKY
jgi:hypothetical protein